MRDRFHERRRRFPRASHDRGSSHRTGSPKSRRASPLVCWFALAHEFFLVSGCLRRFIPLPSSRHQAERGWRRSRTLLRPGGDHGGAVTIMVQGYTDQTGRGKTRHPATWKSLSCLPAALRLARKCCSERASTQRVHPRLPGRRNQWVGKHDLLRVLPEFRTSPRLPRAVREG